MPFPAQVLRVMIASPSDVAAQRDVAEQAILGWNRDNGEARGVLLLPLRWELDAVPYMYRGDAQQTINRQLVMRADIVVAIFHTRLGTPTPRYVAGTAEELEESRKLGLAAHVWESTADIPHGSDIEQLIELKKYMTQLKQEGLIGFFHDNHQLRDQVTRALDLDVADYQADPIKWGARAVQPERGTSTAGSAGVDIEQGLVLPPAEAAGEAKILWTVEDLRRLAADQHVSAARATRVLDVLAARVDTYFSTSQLVEAL